MGGVIVFKKPVAGLVDSTGAAITDGAVAQLQIIPKGTIQRLRVVDQRDQTNPNMLKALGLRMELSTVSSPDSPDVVMLAQLDNPNNSTIPLFFAYVESVKGMVSSDSDAELTFKTTFS